MKKIVIGIDVGKDKILMLEPRRLAALHSIL